jgi:tyrosine-protein phosphatase YwqE
MWLNLFGRRKGEPTNSSVMADWSFLGTDIHSHLIPGIDDGAQTIEDSLELIKRLITLGFKQIITTPHIKYDHYPNNSAIINQGLEELKKSLIANNIHIPIKAAAEYYIDDHFVKLLEAGDLLTITDNQVLVELSFLFEPVRFQDFVFKMMTKGYRPILAHPERYLFYHKKMEIYKELKNMGCLLQLNAASVSGYYGKEVKQAAIKLLEDGLYDYCGTDMHHSRHADTLEKLQNSQSFKSLTNYEFLNKKLIL